jgi:hypothetical protein
MGQSTRERVEQAKAELDRVRSEWLRRSGVTGVDVGFLWQGSTMTDQVGIRVKVEKLLEPEDVPEGELFPRHVGEVPVQVRQEAAPGPQQTG